MNTPKIKREMEELTQTNVHADPRGNSRHKHSYSIWQATYLRLHVFSPEMNAAIILDTLLSLFLSEVLVNRSEYFCI